MEIIYKYQLDITDRQNVKLPIDAEILSIQDQGGVVCMWAKIDPNKIAIDRTIIIYGTGIPCEDIEGTFISTLQVGAMVWHFFQA